MGIFTVEMCVKILADGFVMHKGSYLRFVQANPYYKAKNYCKINYKKLQMLCHFGSPLLKKQKVS